MLAICLNYNVCGRLPRDVRHVPCHVTCDGAGDFRILCDISPTDIGRHGEPIDGGLNSI